MEDAACELALKGRGAFSQTESAVQPCHTARTTEERPRYAVMLAVSFLKCGGERGVIRLARRVNLKKRAFKASTKTCQCCLQAVRDL